MSPPGPESEVLAWIGLRRVHTGRVADTAGRWLDYGRPVPSYLRETLDQLSLAGLLTLAEPTSADDITRRATLTATGHAWYAQLQKRYHRHRARAELQVSDAEFPTNTGRAPVEPVALPTPAASAPRLPAPGRPPTLLCWKPDDQGQLHAVEAADALLSAARGYTETVCGQVQLPADTDFDTDPSGSRCLICVLGATADRPDPRGWST